MKLGIVGQWELEIKPIYKGNDVSSKVHPIQMTDLKDFYVIQEIGNLLPTFHIEFTSASSWKEFWNENMVLFLKMEHSYGSEYPPVIRENYVLLSYDARDLGNSMVLYTASGVLNKPAFTQTPYINAFGPSDGIEVAKKIAEKYFIIEDMNYPPEVIANKTKTSQVWNQSHTSDKKFLDYIISHCYLKKSFVSNAITFRGNWAHRNMSTLSAYRDGAWSVGPRSQIKPIGPLRQISSSGFLNSNACYGMDLPIISAENGIRTVHRAEIELNFTKGKTVSAEQIERRTLPPVYFTAANESENFWLGKTNFDIGHALINMQLFEFVTMDIRPIDALDVALLEDIASNSQDMNQDTSGAYIMHKVAVGIRKNMAIMKVQIGRDTGNKQ
jgi:hypothetical protein